jgi:hypothetical protein
MAATVAVATAYVTAYPTAPTAAIASALLVSRGNTGTRDGGVVAVSISVIITVERIRASVHTRAAENGEGIVVLLRSYFYSSGSRHHNRSGGRTRVV